MKTTGWELLAIWWFGCIMTVVIVDLNGPLITSDIAETIISILIYTLITFIFGALPLIVLYEGLKTKKCENNEWTIL